MFLVCGEALFDFFVNEDSAKRLSFDARMGGSPYNVAVGLRRLGIDTAFFSGLSNDFLGSKLLHSLAAEGVVTGYIIPKTEPTTLSIVELETAGVPRYAFYGQGAADRSLQLTDLPALDAAISGLHFLAHSRWSASQPQAPCWPSVNGSPRGGSSRSTRTSASSRFRISTYGAAVLPIGWHLLMSSR